jgi:lipopolysaccharide export system permease protein
MRVLPRKIDAYVFRELARSAILSSLIAVIVLLGLQALRLSEFMVKYDLDRGIILRMLLGLSVSFVPIIVPIACLFALLGVFGRMSSDREFVAAQAMGIAPARMLLPALCFGVLFSAASFWFAFSAGPAGNRAFESTIDEAFKKRVTSSLRSGTFTEGFLDMVLFVDQVNPTTQNLERVFLHDASNFKEEVSISAKRGKWLLSEATGLGTLRLVDGVVISKDTTKNVVRRVRFDEYKIYADFSSASGVPRDSPASLGWTALMARRHGEGHDLRSVWVQIAQRFAVSLSCLFFVPLAFALALDNSRTAKSRAVMTGLLVLFGYWTLYFALVTWIMKTNLSFVAGSEACTWMAIWVPNLVLAGWGGWLFRKKRRGVAA